MTRHLALALAAILAASAAAAHEFTVTFIVPQAAQTQARNAFLLASSERDSHPDETSEGHLGGVDSQLEIVAPGAPVPASDIVVAIAPATLPAPDTGAWAFTMTNITARARADFLDATAFSDRYTARYGMPPDDTATRTYIAARLIDLAVRMQDGTDDRAALAAATAGY